MNINLRNIGIFYVVGLTPLIALIGCAKGQYINSIDFTIGLLIYLFIYHPFVAGIRLVQSNKISLSQFGNNFIPGWNFKYFWFLFFNK